MPVKTSSRPAAQRRLINVDGPKLGYVPNFDGMRGIFVLQVVLFHAKVTTFLTGSPILIDLFFVLSGFLITYLLLDECKKSGDISLRRFYMRRVLRLFPAMYLMVGIFTVLMVTIQLFGPPEVRDLLSNWWLEVVGAVTYTYFILAAFFPTSMGLLGLLWTLSVEEFFYLLWPPSIRRMLRRGTLRSDAIVIGISLAFIALMFFLRSHFQFVVGSAAEGAAKYADVLGGTGSTMGRVAGTEIAGGARELPQYASSWQGVVYRLASMRPDMIVWGSLMAFVAKSIPRPVPDRIRRWTTFLGVCGWGFLIATSLFAAPGPPGPLALFGGLLYQFSLLMLGPVVIDAYLRQDTFYTWPFRLAPSKWLGERSYGIYLWHALVLLVGAPVILAASGAMQKVLGVVVTVIAVGVGALSFRYIELRFLKLKDRKFASPAASK